MLTRLKQAFSPPPSKPKTSSSSSPTVQQAKTASSPPPSSTGRNEARPGTASKGFSGASSFESSGRRNLVALNAPLPQKAPEPAAFAPPEAAKAQTQPQAQAAAPASEPTTAQRAGELYEEISGTVGKPPAEWNEGDAARYTEALAEQIEAHKDDPELVRSLMTLAGKELQRSAEILGRASEDDDLNDEDVESLAANVSRIGNAAPEDAAQKLAYAVAQQVPEDSEQNQFDDGFGHFIDDGGDPHFRDLVAAALLDQGKPDAAEELVEKHGGSSIGDFLGDSLGAIGGLFEGVTEVAGDAIDFGGDVVGAVVDGGTRLIGAAGDFAIDAAQGTLEFAGDVAELTAEAVEEGIRFAAEQGLKLAGPIVEKARDLIQNAVLDGLNIEEKINTLGPGDTLSIGGSVNVTAGIDVGVEADLQVKANEDGTYTVSGEVAADLGVKLFGGGTLGAGGKVEFTFPNKEAAVRGAETLALAGAGAAAALTPPFQAVAPLLLPGGDDLQHLTSNISAIELSADAAASVEAELGLGSTTAGAEAGVEAGVTYRLELEDGKPTALVRQQKLEGTVGAGLSADLFANSGVAGSLDLAQAEAEASLTVSTRIPLPDDLGDVGDILQAGAFIADVTGGLSNLLPNAETSIEGSVSVSGGGTPSVGAEVTFEAPDVELTDGLAIASELVQGHFSEALRNLPDVTISGNTYTETGFEVDGGLEIFGQGIDLNLHNVVKDVQNPFEVTLFD